MRWGLPSPLLPLPHPLRLCGRTRSIYPCGADADAIDGADGVAGAGHGAAAGADDGADADGAAAGDDAGAHADHGAGADDGAFYAASFILPDVPRGCGLGLGNHGTTMTHRDGIVRPGACYGCRAVWGRLRAGGGGDHASAGAAASVRAARLLVPRSQRQ